MPLEFKKTVKIFRTNVSTAEQAKSTVGYLLKVYPAYKINFDLDDSDRILRVESDEINAKHIEVLVNSSGYVCMEIPD